MSQETVEACTYVAIKSRKCCATVDGAWSRDCKSEWQYNWYANIIPSLQISINSHSKGPQTAMSFAAQLGHSGIVHDLLKLNPALASTGALSLAITNGYTSFSLL